MTCPTCVGFREKLAAWHTFRTEARENGETCSCVECEEGSRWREASASPSAWREASTCGKEADPSLVNPARPNEIPKFNRLGCSLDRKVSPAGNVSYYPKHITRCQSCGWDKMAPSNCPLEMSDKECEWVEKQEAEGGKGSVWATVKGTRQKILLIPQEH